jgi:hypothetical protein
MYSFTYLSTYYIKVTTTLRNNVRLFQSVFCILFLGRKEGRKGGREIRKRKEGRKEGRKGGREIRKRKDT